MTTTPGRSRQAATGQAATEVENTGPRPRRIVGRWLLSFLGFPLGGYAAALLVGPLDTITAALVGGLIAGAVLGGAQAWALGPRGPRPSSWVAATAAGLAVGVALGSAAVDYATDVDALLVQGAITGAAVGLAQAVLLLPRLRIWALVWPVALAGLWALGWLVTDSVIGSSVDQQFYVFGSSGALTVTALTSALPLALSSRTSSNRAHRPSTVTGVDPS
jgi:hypothetical protein